jgi:predicted  nucleic acid-binding Zn-ribbon protein
MDELKVLSKRRNDGDYINSTFERYNLKLYDYEYPDLPEIRRKYNKLKKTLRSGLVVIGDAYNQVIQNKRDDAFTPPHSELGLADSCLDEVWKEIDDLRHKIDGMKGDIRELYRESKKEKPSISQGEFVSTERFRETFEEIQELEKKMRKLGEIWNWRQGKIRHKM